jgi:uncharacterized membrane protein YfcA
MSMGDLARPERRSPPSWLYWALPAVGLLAGFVFGIPGGYLYATLPPPRGQMALNVVCTIDVAIAFPVVVAGIVFLCLRGRRLLGAMLLLAAGLLVVGLLPGGLLGASLRRF